MCFSFFFLPGAALHAMLDFFQALVSASMANFSQKKLLDLLINPVVAPTGAQIHKQGRASIAKCVAALVTQGSSPQSQQEAHAVVNKFTTTLTQAGGGQPHQQTFALLAIGEIGKHMYEEKIISTTSSCIFNNFHFSLGISSDLSKNTNLKTAILESFNHPNEEVKQAASYALGNLSLGNLKEYLPFVLGEIETKPKRQYLLLHSLKEVRS